MPLSKKQPAEQELESLRAKLAPELARITELESFLLTMETLSAGWAIAPTPKSKERSRTPRQGRHTAKKDKK